MESARPGTTSVDGLLEGPLPPGGARTLEDWVQIAHRQGLVFDLAIDGGSFSLLPEGVPRPTPASGVTEPLRVLLVELLELWPPDRRGRVFSTLRSVEYRNDRQLQSIIGVTPDGVLVKTREVPWTPGLAPRRVGLRFLGAMGLLVLAILISPLVIDYGGLWEKWTTFARTVDPAAIEIDTYSVDRYLAIVDRSLGPRGDELLVVLGRTEHYPADLAAYRREVDRIEAEGSLVELVALEQLIVSGVARVEYIDSEGARLGSWALEVRPLLALPRTEVRIPLRRFPAWRRLRIVY